jgi:hypothetical protein
MIRRRQACKTDRKTRNPHHGTWLMVMMTLAEKEDKAPPPVVTIPAN